MRLTGAQKGPTRDESHASAPADGEPRVGSEARSLGGGMEGGSQPSARTSAGRQCAPGTDPHLEQIHVSVELEKQVTEVAASRWGPVHAARQRAQRARLAGARAGAEHPCCITAVCQAGPTKKQNAAWRGEPAWHTGVVSLGFRFYYGYYPIMGMP